MRKFILASVTAVVLAFGAATYQVEAAAPANPQYVVTSPQYAGGYYYGPTYTYYQPTYYYPAPVYYYSPYYTAYPTYGYGGGVWIGGWRFGLGVRWR